MAVRVRPVLQADDMALVPHDPTHAEARPLAARSASRPASCGGHPQRGSPTLTSISTSGTPACAAASIVASESTATVMRAPARATRRAGRVDHLVRQRRSSPSPARAIPSISRDGRAGERGVARRRPGGSPERCTCVFTCGRNRVARAGPAMIRTLPSSRSASTRSAGVVSSVILIPGTLPTARVTRWGVAGYCPHVSTPWLGDACSLVEAFRAGTLSPLEALDSSIAAIGGVAAQRLQLHRLRPGEGGGSPGRPVLPLRGRAVRRQGAREGGGLALHGGIRDLPGPGRRP